MSHRKGEITGYANEWDFPHLAELELLPPAMRTWLGILLPRRTYSPLWPTERRTPAVAEGHHKVRPTSVNSVGDGVIKARRRPSRTSRPPSLSAPASVHLPVKRQMHHA
jgi:hypothetical protein